MIVINYHCIVDDNEYDDFDSGLYTRTSVSQYCRDMQDLHDRFTFVSLPEIVSSLKHGRTIPGALALTFDDCYQGVLRWALPIAEAYGIRATLFVVTSYMSAASPFCFEFDKLEIGLRLSRISHLDCSELGLGRERVALDSTGAKLTFLRKVKARLKRLPQSSARKCQAELLERLGTDEHAIHEYAERHSKYRPMQWDEARAALAAGHTIGSHSVSHPVLTHMPAHQADAEITRSGDAIRERLGVDEIPFAYPYGRDDHVSREIHELVCHAGYAYAVTTIPGPNLPGIDLFGLRRMVYERGQLV